LYTRKKHNFPKKKSPGIFCLKKQQILSGRKKKLKKSRVSSGWFLSPLSPHMMQNQSAWNQCTLSNKHNRIWLTQLKEEAEIFKLKTPNSSLQIQKKNTHTHTHTKVHGTAFSYKNTWNKNFKKHTHTHTHTHRDKCMAQLFHTKRHGTKIKGNKPKRAALNSESPTLSQ
jgi:hypothetical protein